MKKEVKIPMIVGMILYGIALIIDLVSVFAQKAVFDFMGADDIHLDSLAFPFITVCQIAVMAMFISFFLVMLFYKGHARRVAGIVMIVVYCVVNIVMPFIDIQVTRMTAIFQGENGLAAMASLKNFIGTFTSPFVTVSTVLLFVAIGRYGIINKENNAEMLEYNDRERANEND